MATLKWDHAVQFVNHPEAAIQTLNGQKLNAVSGGRHPGWGTWNALSYFGLTYIEFLAIADDAELLSAAEKFLLSRDASRLLPDNEALYRVALRSSDIERTHAWLHEQGLRVSSIVDGQRNDPQGNAIRWRIFTIDGDFDGLVYPFVLQWGEDDDARLSRLRAQGLAAPHPLGRLNFAARFLRYHIPRRCVTAGSCCLVFPLRASWGWRSAVESLFSARGSRTN